MRIDAHEREMGVSREVPVSLGEALKQLNDLASTANAFLFDLGGGPSAFGDLRLSGLGRKIYRDLFNARIRADALLRITYLKNPESFIADGYRDSDITHARMDVLIALQAVYDDYQVPRRRKVTISESTLMRVRNALGH